MIDEVQDEAPSQEKDIREGLGPIEIQIINLLGLQPHVLYALNKIVEAERGFKNSRISTIRDVIVQACEQRAEIYNRYSL